jgi:hypothetical protein
MYHVRGDCQLSAAKGIKWNLQSIGIPSQRPETGDLQRRREARNETVKMMYTFLVGGEYEQAQKLTGNEIRHAEH